MNNATLPKNEYKKLLFELDKINRELRWFLVKKMRVSGGALLLDVAKLKLHGGPKNLSSKLDYYLYA